MRTILIPIDFSDTTENLLQYASDFCVDNKVERVILLKCYYVSSYEQLLPSPDFVQVSADDIVSEKKALDEQLQAAGRQLQKNCKNCFDIQTAFSDLPLARAIHKQIADKQPNLVMMASDKTSDESNSRSAEQIIVIAKTSPIPVMIIPSNVKYKKIEQALVPCDFTATARLSALKGFHDRERWIHPQLMVLNVDAKQKYVSNNEQLTAGLADILKGYEYDIYYSDDKDTVNGILAFARKHDVQLIIALPGKYSFFYNLTHRSITQALALNAIRPVLILK
jgi:nucleotide-binding universal stress UspA family protein